MRTQERGRQEKGILADANGTRRSDAVFPALQRGRRGEEASGAALSATATEAGKRRRWNSGVCKGDGGCGMVCAMPGRARKRGGKENSPEQSEDEAMRRGRLPPGTAAACHRLWAVGDRACRVGSDVPYGSGTDMAGCGRESGLPAPG